MAEGGQGRRFFSLKWKALVLISIVLIGIVASLSVHSYMSLLRQFEVQRNVVYQQNVTHIRGLIDRSAQQLQQLGGVIPAMTGMSAPLVAGDASRTRSTFNQHWPTFQINLGVEIVRFYAKDNRLLGSWGDEPAQKKITNSVLGWVWNANEREKPLSVLDCTVNCIQYVVVPLLAEGRSVGVVLLGRTLADVILDFKQASDSDVGVIITSEGDRELEDALTGRWLPRWNAEVVAITNPEKTLPVLRRTTRHAPDMANVTAGVRVSNDNRTYELRLVPFDDVLNNNKANLVLLADISAPLARIDADIRSSLITAVAGLVLAEGLMLAFLTVPMSRLQTTAMSLPLLSRSDFAGARTMLAAKENWLHLDDEVDALNRTTVKLSHQLESLENEAARQTRALAQRADELAVQKDFVTSLLNTAQAVIITQNSHGEITMINQYGEALLGYSNEEIQGGVFSEYVREEDLLPEIYRDLMDLTAGRRRYLNHELNMKCNDGKPRFIAWYHSCPPGGAGRDADVLSVGIDITERKIAEERLSWMADHDSLTGLYNRRRFQLELEKMIAQAKRRDYGGAVLYLDIDQFKDVNDSSGHHAGDLLLKNVGNCLAEAMKQRGMVARLGGDEFAIILPDTLREGAIDTARKLERHLNNITLPIEGRIHRISASIGIAVFPDHGDTTQELLANADIAMYKAKDSGRGCWHVFTTSDQLRERVHKRVYWKDRLQQALANDHFVMFYQPIIDVNSGAATHYEALLRLADEDGSITSPGAFIEVAEANGIIHSIDRVVVGKVIDQLEALHEAGIKGSFSVNLSAHAFNSQELFTILRERISQASFDPARLIFEVTETAAVADFAAAREYILAMNELGCRFALDDFGVGFSSFYSLKQLPVDYVKIDGSFIQHLHENPDDQMLVQAISQVARGFGKKTIAEFVDNEKVLDLLREYAIDYAQGFLLGKPAPAESLFALPSRKSGNRTR